MTSLYRYFGGPLDGQEREIESSQPVIWVFRDQNGSLAEFDDEFLQSKDGVPHLRYGHPGLRSPDNDAAIMGRIEGFYVMRVRLPDGSGRIEWTGLEEMLWHL